MSIKIQIRRGGTTARMAITPDAGEPCWDTNLKQFFIGDGVTAGGVAVKASVPTGYIDGLKMKRVSATALTVSSGSAYIPGLGATLAAASDIALSGLALAASTWYHAHLYSNSGTPAIELSTTAPDTPYIGTARCKTGDTSRRYVGSVLTDGSSNLFSFTHSGNTVQYKANIFSSPFRVLASGTATTATTISLASLIPVTAAFALLSTTNSDSSVAAVFGCSDQGYTLDANNWSSLLNPSSAVIGPYVIDGSQAIQYMYRSARTGVVDVRVVGYVFER